MKFEDNLLLYIQSKANIIQIVTSESLRIQGAVNEVCKSLEREWFVWNRIEGLKKWNSQKKVLTLESSCDCKEPSEIIETILERDDAAIYILDELHHDLEEPKIQQRLKNFLTARNPNKTIILAQSVPCLPKELEKEIVLLEIPLPSKEDLKVILENVCSEKNIDMPIDKSEAENQILDSALGLTIMEAELAFRKAIASKGKISEESISMIVSV